MALRTYHVKACRAVDLGGCREQADSRCPPQLNAPTSPAGPGGHPSGKVQPTTGPARRSQQRLSSCNGFGQVHWTRLWIKRLATGQPQSQGCGLPKAASRSSSRSQSSLQGPPAEEELEWLISGSEALHQGHCCLWGKAASAPSSNSLATGEPGNPIAAGWRTGEVQPRASTKRNSSVEVVKLVSWDGGNMSAKLASALLVSRAQPLLRGWRRKSGCSLAKCLETFAGPGRAHSGLERQPHPRSECRWMRWIFPATRLCITEKGAGNPPGLSRPARANSPAPGSRRWCSTPTELIKSKGLPSQIQQAALLDAQNRRPQPQPPERRRRSRATSRAPALMSIRQNFCPWVEMRQVMLCSLPVPRSPHRGFVVLRQAGQPAVQGTRQCP